MNISPPIAEYMKSSQHICMSSSISILLILIFIVSPLNKYFMTSLFGKLIILILLGYTLFFNVKLTTKFSKQFNTSVMSGSWTPIKTNLICSHIFSGFLFVLFLSVLRCLFK